MKRGTRICGIRSGPPDARALSFSRLLQMLRTIQRPRPWFWAISTFPDRRPAGYRFTDVKGYRAAIPGDVRSWGMAFGCSIWISSANRKKAKIRSRTLFLFS